MVKKDLINIQYRQFEIPYNFDTSLIQGLQILNIPQQVINCFYMPPFPDDYTGIIRRQDTLETLYKIDKKEYYKQILYINQNYPNKLQLLLQQNNKEHAFAFKDKLPFYINELNFYNFCVGSIEQAKIIKDILPNAVIIGSITMHINNQKILDNYKEYKQYFNGFVLDFHFNRELNNIRKLPKDFQYIMLINSSCYNQCNGTQHWFIKYKEQFGCPYLDFRRQFQTNCLIRPMDLFIFDPYIAIYKFIDRGFPTSLILHDLILYLTNSYEKYPNIVYTEDIYNKRDLK